MHILVLIAGTNEPSNSNVLADAFIKGIGNMSGVTVEKLRLNDLHLEHFTLEHYEPHTEEEPDFIVLKQAVLGADGIVIATPVWNFGVPAHLKNAIDRIGSFGLDTERRSKGQFKGKPVYFLFTGGAPKAAWKGLMRFTTSHVPEAFRYFGCTIAGSFFEGRCTVRGKFGLILDKRPEVLQRAEQKGQAFAKFVRNFKETGQLPLYHRMLTKMYLMGQRVVAKL